MKSVIGAALLAAATTAAAAQDIPGIGASAGSATAAVYAPPSPSLVGNRRTAPQPARAARLPERTPPGSEIPGSEGPRAEVIVPSMDASPVPLVSQAPVKLTPNETKAIAVARSWRDKSEPAATGASGAITFAYGAALPSLVCAPLYVCAIKLQAGEVVNDIHAGDSVRWRISPATSGAGDAKTVSVMVKPTDAGLTSNLTIATDRRLYTIKLVSTSVDWMPLVEFSYPEDAEAQWAAYHRQQDAQQESLVMKTTGQDIAKLDFDFDLTGDHPSWRPMRVYSDGQQTFIQFPPAMLHDEAPVLVALDSSGDDQLVNYRVKDSMFVVDKVLRRAALISGVGGAQERVEISHRRAG